MATRSKKPRRPVKKNSKIAEAQKAASERRIERQDSLRGQSSNERARTQGPKPTKLEPRTSTPMAGAGKGLDQERIAQRDNTAGTSITAAANKISGLAAPVMAQMQKDYALANPDLYGSNAANRSAKLAAMAAAANEANAAKLKEAKTAVYMGQRPMKQSMTGRESIDPETGKRTQNVSTLDDIQSSDDLMAWLADPAKVEEIKSAALKSGLAVQSYDDISKLWGSVVTQAAATFTKTGQKVTPWALIAMRGKYAGPDGRMQDKVTTSTQIDEMDPATARKMFEQTATQMLGRTATNAEIDDFIAKAQTIAKANPSIITSRSKTGFDGLVEQGTTQTTTKGGGQAVTDQAEMAAQDMAKQSDDYGAYQAAGTYFPLLFQALSAPV